MFHYFYGNLGSLQMNPSPKAQETIRLQQKYFIFLDMIPAMFDNEGNLINLPDEGGLMDQDFYTMRIVLTIKDMYIEYINSKNKGA